MNRRFLLFALLLACHAATAQRNYWQQFAEYTIDVSLNDADHSLDGFLDLRYVNQSPDTLQFIWFHLWPNAYKNDLTAFSEQLLRNNNTSFYFSDKGQRGYINRLDFRANNSTCRMEDHPTHIDIVKVYLPEPLPPGRDMRITTPFHVQLPEVFSRSGHKGQTYLVAQWYPKPAVYDKEGWHPMPYLDQGEFYGEFANYDIRITLPKNYIVAASGTLQTPEEKQWLIERSKIRPKDSVKTGATARNIKNAVPPKADIPSDAVTKTIRYKLENAHDFAWFADKSFQVEYDTLLNLSRRTIELFSYYPPAASRTWNNSIALMKEAIRFREAQLGDYPYPVISAVQVPMGIEGGMEYPTITAISVSTNRTELDLILEHEIGHNWFQGILASNERQFPWLDEGLNTFYNRKYEKIKYGPADSAKGRKQRLEDLLVQSLISLHKDQPIATSAEDFSADNYNYIAYSKTAMWLEKWEKEIGPTLMESRMKTYFRDWQFRHPYPDDFFSILSSPDDKGGTLFREGYTSSHLPLQGSTVPLKWKTSFGIRPIAPAGYHQLSALPLPGFNRYDGPMLGIALHNYALPPSNFRFILLPQWGFNSRRPAGTGYLSYTTFPQNRWQRMDWSLNAAHYATLQARNVNGDKIFGTFSKIVPAVRLTLAPKNPGSSITKWLEWKTFLIREKGFRYVLNISDSQYYPVQGKALGRYVNQLTYAIISERKLYPYDLRFQLQQGKEFYRASLTGNYFLNYPKGGGAGIRFFAAKFGYLGTRTPQKEFSTYAYQPKLTAVRGNEDYTYSSYFIGRNDYEGFNSHQIMMRDGGLKIRTDLFQNLQGRSDNWIASLNFTTTLPAAIIPAQLPLKLFFDAGTYAAAWNRESNATRILYVGGLQLSFARETINIYLPLVYSKIFADSFKSVPETDKFASKISFSIDLQRLPQKIPAFKFLW